MSVQLTLFDLEAYNAQPTAEIILVDPKAKTNEKAEFQQLELNLFPKSHLRVNRIQRKVAA